MGIPPTIDGDLDAVADALHAARVAWRVDRARGIYWVRRAAQVAERGGHNDRALVLALAATELEEQLAGSGTVPVAKKYDEHAVTQEHALDELLEYAKRK